MSYLRIFVSFFILPNAIFWIASAFFPASRGAFNIDYPLIFLAVAPLASFFNGHILYRVLLGLFLAIDVLFFFSLAYYFRAFDFLASIQYLSSLSSPYPYLFGAMIVLAMLLVIWLASKAVFSTGRNLFTLKNSVFCILLITFIVGMDCWNNTGWMKHSDSTIVPVNIAMSGTYKLRKLIRKQFNKRSITPLGVGEYGTEELSDVLRNNPALLDENANYVLILVESLGKTIDAHVESTLFSSFLNEEMKKKYFVTFSSVPFRGSTVMGEFRELCGVAIDSIWKIPKDLSQCLPNLFNGRGYRTVALHGFTENFFDRKRWYPEVGFQKTIFLENLKNADTVEYCGSVFRGVCDISFPKLLLAELKNSKTFLYWLTLTSHIPISPRDVVDTQSISSCDALPDSLKDVCNTLRIQEKTLADIARLALDSNLPPTYFIIVGDHRPPFLSRNVANSFSEERVPMLLLKPIL